MGHFGKSWEAKRSPESYFTSYGSTQALNLRCPFLLNSSDLPLLTISLRKWYSARSWYPQNSPALRKLPFRYSFSDLEGVQARLKGVNIGIRYFYIIRLNE